MAYEDYHEPQDEYGSLFIAFLICLLLAIFWNDEVTPRDYYNAEKVCEDLGGLHKVDVDPMSIEITCKNYGVSTSITREAFYFLDGEPNL